MLGGIIGAILSPVVAAIAPIIEAAKPSPEVTKARIDARLERDRMRHAERMAKIQRR